jgi:hypothetical protein
MVARGFGDYPPPARPHSLYGLVADGKSSQINKYVMRYVALAPLAQVSQHQHFCCVLFGLAALTHQYTNRPVLGHHSQRSVRSSHRGSKLGYGMGCAFLN